ncbi:MAG: hypothetical protein A3G52_03745 [Candidatus Taylorbacteria bacterium RIFCSPLOWO2_12_FULL_43_20]|uniref:Uncharacterized protein n=1 Tax=Candidatus Taylorbacteria bacterium RIFCSPLOWO2_12_FULL_43_20 TaxID=1802332 RepID=A0A1G2P3Z0_9BACT|nr:MAG: hypothetical protein A2825_00705 [Candidatus Taylorbacteria bacterium RIFCSPHIGHO2_01_FULL_43_120]OHA22867.1 MAG: hypothetical protein A3B98_01580 [Candidatus Taylorbacteria bacterium RIFCSPHIGHO2_02_FULL_43_55]OHA29350.1 MAG: hypothetical protein A3E92_02315 [Candidatus Taylorbacteria bacterium RIFCSPHIGHO2_12_FULL_42_34]OHA31727.1 MAG: hypothetical protein A3B09_01760 [Candidatus Taylorbacteria bacterium RIFCSPLOWO2_01_FULL_43_83]OHA38778.1 MAG: hypothetical protein A3H58_01870 [Candi
MLEKREICVIETGNREVAAVFVHRPGEYRVISWERSERIGIIKEKILELEKWTMSFGTGVLATWSGCDFAKFFLEFGIFSGNGFVLDIRTFWLTLSLNPETIVPASVLEFGASPLQRAKKLAEIMEHLIELRRKLSEHAHRSKLKL